MESRLPRVTPVLHLSRVSTAFSAVANAVFVLLWTRAVEPEASHAAPQIAPQAQLWLPMAAAVFFSIGMFAYAASLNDLIDARRDETHNPSRPIPAGAIRANAALLFTLTALLVGVAAATWLGSAATRAAVVTALLILVYNATFKFLPAFSFTTIGIIHAANMLTINPSIEAVWPIVLIMIHATASAAAAHLVSRRRPRISTLGWLAIVTGSLFWVSALLAYTRIRHGALLPDWLGPTAFIGPSLLALTFALFCYVKLRRVKRNRTAAEKLYRYAAIWTPLYATAWCFSLAPTFPDLRAAGFTLAAIGILGLLGVTTLREVYAVVEHPVGYRR